MCPRRKRIFAAARRDAERFRGTESAEPGVNPTKPVPETCDVVPTAALREIRARLEIAQAAVHTAAATGASGMQSLIPGDPSATTDEFNKALVGVRAERERLGLQQYTHMAVIFAI